MKLMFSSSNMSYTHAHVCWVVPGCLQLPPQQSLGVFVSSSLTLHSSQVKSYPTVLPVVVLCVCERETEGGRESEIGRDRERKEEARESEMVKRERET